MKKIKVLIELPSNWLEESQGEGVLMLLGQIRERFADRVFDKAVDKALEDLKIPKIEIKPEEIKDRMLSKLAEKALEDN